MKIFNVYKYESKNRRNYHFPRKTVAIHLCNYSSHNSALDKINTIMKGEQIKIENDLFEITIKMKG